MIPNSPETFPPGSVGDLGRDSSNNEACLFGIQVGFTTAKHLQDSHRRPHPRSQETYACLHKPPSRGIYGVYPLSIDNFYSEQRFCLDTYL